MMVARQQHEWDRTAQVIATLANLHRPPETPPLTGRSLNPYRGQGGSDAGGAGGGPRIKGTVAMLWSLFGLGPDGQGPDARRRKGAG